MDTDLTQILARLDCLEATVRDLLLERDRVLELLDQADKATGYYQAQPHG